MFKLLEELYAIVGAGMRSTRPTRSIACSKVGVKVEIFFYRGCMPIHV